MRNHYAFCSLLLGVCTFFTGCITPSDTPSLSRPKDATTTTTAVDGIQALVEPLRGIITDSSDRELSAQFHDEFADVIARDKDIITSTGMIREGYVRAETLMLQRTELVGKYPGFGAAKDAVLKEVLGLENAALTDEKRADAVEAFRAIAKAIRNKDDSL
jgi:hypothetical protein